MSKIPRDLVDRDDEHESIHRPSDDFWRSASKAPKPGDVQEDSPAMLVNEILSRQEETEDQTETDDELSDDSEPTSTRQSDTTEERLCGPDITDWFKGELQRWMEFAWELNEAAKKWGEEGNAGEKLYQYATLAIVARQLIYEPTTNFVSASGMCPKNCANTVTLCGGCIHRSELGNFVYGVLARYFQMTWSQTWLGSIYGNRGTRTDSDKAAVALGYDFIDKGYTSAADLCKFFGRSRRFRKNWADMQKDGHGCPPCSSIVPPNAPGTTFPNVADLAANKPITVTVPSTVTGNP